MNFSHKKLIFNSKMNSTISVNNKGSPALFLEDSGYESLGRRNLCKHSFTGVTESGYTKAAKRPKIHSVDTIKKRLFVHSPYSSEEKSWLESPMTVSFLSPMKRKNRQERAKVSESPMDLTLNAKGLNKGLSPKCPASPLVKFYYSPLKNSKLFRIVTPTPQKSDAAANKAGNAESWGISVSLPDHRCDVLKKLWDKNMYFAVSAILSHLSEEDLCRASCVSKDWKQIVLSDLDAKEKRESYVQKRFISKENKKDPLIKEEASTENVNDGIRKLLLDVTNKEIPKQLVTSKAPEAKLDCFVDVASRVTKAEVILKCPMCHNPAKCQIGNKYRCTRNLCNYTFCKKCLGMHAHSDRCPALGTIPNVIVGSKRSRRNLRRL